MRPGCESGCEYGSAEAYVNFLINSNATNHQFFTTPKALPARVGGFEDAIEGGRMIFCPIPCYTSIRRSGPLTISA